MKKQIHFMKRGAPDFHGYCWFFAYRGNTPVKVDGIHIAYRAITASRAMEMHIKSHNYAKVSV